MVGAELSSDLSIKSDTELLKQKAGMEQDKTVFNRRITEGPILKSVWHIAWPTMLQNMIAGLQGVVDHAMVGHYVGYLGNAAIGVSWQIFLVVVVFISSLYSGMNVLVARFAGEGDAGKVNRTVYQGFLASVFVACLVLAPAGYFFTPVLLNFVNAAPEVQVHALPYLRIMFVFSIGKLLFFMLGGALRSAGDAKTPLRLGVLMTVLNLLLNVILIRGMGPVPGMGATGAAIGTVVASGTVSLLAVYLLFKGHLVVQFRRAMRWRPDWSIISALFKFGLPTGFQGVAVNIGGVLLLRFVGSLPESAAAQAAFTVCYTQLFALVTWTSVGIMGGAATVAGQNLGAKKPERTRRVAKSAASIGLMVASTAGLIYLFIPELVLGVFGMKDPRVLEIAVELLRYLSLSGLFVTVALAYTGSLQGTGDTRSPMIISIISQVIIPIGYCYLITLTRALQTTDIWMAILLGHFTRMLLSVLRFHQGKWQTIEVDIAPERV